MKYEIQNNSPFGKAFKVVGGTHEVRRGETEIVDLEHELAPEQIEAHGRNGVTIILMDRKALAARAKAEREALLAKAVELGLDVPAEIDGEALKALVAEAEAKANPATGK